LACEKLGLEPSSKLEEARQKKRVSETGVGREEEAEDDDDEDADTAGSGGMAPNRPASAREELTWLDSTLDCCSALAASVREKSVHLLSRMDANVRTGVKTSEAEAGAGGQGQVEELLVYA